MNSSSHAPSPRVIFGGLAGTIFEHGGFDAAMVEPASGTGLYLFKGDQYVRYDTKAEAIM
ncbi:hemopexin repeat-containing protein [Nocardia noduli]|uniref:hemopexin repeat-containing protein n=1 Tax=Nocardia noduli TaxID=2815722 RepID=UPI0020B17F50|nr:hemopexin repeat-containing protein [Nocardia noduli]